ncbi:MAG: HDIG domain-containing protein [Anaerolineae bacterium]|nr:HDIG domain-containing protein [Anaerolineae bacterium]
MVYEFAPAEDVIEDLDAGQVAPGDILAPQQFEYVSEIRTQAEREQKYKSVSTIYTRPDPKVARQQVERLREIFDYLETIRADPYGSLVEKSEWIAAIPDLTLSDIVVDQILIIDDNNWSKTRQEALAVLNQAMRGEIRENQVTTMRRQLPTFISLDTPDEYANVIVDITEDLLKPNTFPDEARTETERQAAVNAVEPVKVKFEKSESIISAGQIIGPREKEALEVLRSLRQPQTSWTQDFIAPAFLMLFITIIVSVYLVQYAPGALMNTKRLTLLALLLLIFVAAAKFMIPYAGLAYLYPVAALTMITVIVIDAQLAFILTTVLAFLAGYLTSDNTTALVIYLIFSGWAGALVLGRGQRVNDLLLGAVYVSIINVGVLLIFNLDSIAPDNLASLLLILAQGGGNGLISLALVLIGLFAIGNVLGITTSLQLMDLGRPTHPLLRQLLLKAPGSYQHSLMVGNLAEQAAERIGANALLVRVMAYYHDIGKIQRPYFFIENQREGVNVHEKLEPQISAQIIISHVKDGLDLVQKYRLPKVIKDGIAQHHGTSLVRYFFHQALKAAEEKNVQVDETHFRYPGPIPQTRETGILMLADVSETTVRALKPDSAEEVDHIVGQAMADKLNTGQLDMCELTMADLHQIRTAFVDMLQGIHHPRIKYPEQIEADEDATKQENVATQKSQPSPGRKPSIATKPMSSRSTPSSLHPAETESRPMPLVRRE